MSNNKIKIKHGSKHKFRIKMNDLTFEKVCTLDELEKITKASKIEKINVDIKVVNVLRPCKHIDYKDCLVYLKV